jgi:hypothetical protein
MPSDPPLRPDPDAGFVRPVDARYRDPVELIWLATARRLGLTVRRSRSIYSATNGDGLLELGPADTLDADDCIAQMIFHEICHWVTNGVETAGERDWGFPLDDDLDWREHACLRLQAAWASTAGLRHQLAPTSPFRAYYDRLPDDPFAPLDDSAWEAAVVRRARGAFTRARGVPWDGPVGEALRATATIRGVVAGFLGDYATDAEDDALPSLWAR